MTKLPARAGSRAEEGGRVRMKRAFVFPGQGSQAVGMGRALAAAFTPARRLFEEVDDALSQNLSQLMFEGPESDLTLTENAQPALMSASLAVIRVLQAESDFDLGCGVAYVAGHSLGEYSALAAAGALAVDDAVRLLKIRGRAMQQAVPVGDGAMAALLGLDLGAGALALPRKRRKGRSARWQTTMLRARSSSAGIARPSNAASRSSREYGARRAISLPVSAPFHSPLMAPAADVMEQALARVALQRPAVPLVANLSATAVSDPAAIKRGLVGQVTEMVRWRESVLLLAAAGVEEIVEIGCGRVLAGLAKRIAPQLSARSVGDPAEVHSLIEGL